VLSSKSNTKPRPNPKAKPKKRTLAFDAIGTSWQIDLPLKLAEDEFNQLNDNIKYIINQFDKTYSRFRADSLVSKMAQKADTYELPKDAKPMLELYYSLYDISRGQVTPLIGQLMSDAGYDSEYSLLPKELRQVPNWNETIMLDWPEVTIQQPILLDFGAIGKGYLVDLVAELLVGQNVDNFLVNAGGDMIDHQTNKKPRRIGLEHPNRSDEVVGVAYLENSSLCGSAGNRRAWQGFNHIMNPKTRAPMTNLLSVWAMADTTMLADAMTTALYFVEPATLKQAYEFEYAFIRPDYSLEYSPGFKADFF
jgi:thiamine biosynthesis lipoprotein